MRRLYVGYLIVVANGAGVFLIASLLSIMLDAGDFLLILRSLFGVFLYGCIFAGFLLFIGSLAYWSYLFIERYARGRTVETTLPAKTRWQKIFRVVDVVVILSIGVISTGLLALIARNVYRAITQQRMRIAQSEIENMETACAKLLTDASRNRLVDIFDDVGSMFANYGGDVAAWSAVVPELLRKGRDANVPLKPEIRAVIGTAYLDVHNDPWGNPYQIYAPIPDSSLRPAVPGQMPAHPAQLLYVWSMGKDEKSSILFVDAPPQRKPPQAPPPPGTGSDDINNWDPFASWGRFYFGF